MQDFVHQQYGYHGIRFLLTAFGSHNVRKIFGFPWLYANSKSAQFPNPSSQTQPEPLDPSRNPNRNLNKNPDRNPNRNCNRNLYRNPGKNPKKLRKP